MTHDNDHTGWADGSNVRLREGGPITVLGTDDEGGGGFHPVEVRHPVIDTMMTALLPVMKSVGPLPDSFWGEVSKYTPLPPSLVADMVRVMRQPLLTAYKPGLMSRRHRVRP